MPPKSAMIGDGLVPVELSGRPLDAAVRTVFGLSWGEARARIRSGKLTVNGAVRTDPLFRVRGGAELKMNVRAPRVRPLGLPDAAIVHVDTHVVVVNKPAGIASIPYEEGDTGTLDELVRDWLARNAGTRPRSPRPALGVVHRLDKETSGLIVFTRTWLAKKSLASQFRAHTVERRYLAIAHGEVSAKTLRSRIVADRGDGLRGSYRRPAGSGQGQLAITHVEVLEPLAGATLIACRLETGRTHQIRIHLSEAGHPLLGERVYVRRYVGEQLPAPRLMLHAAELGFTHPVSSLENAQRVRWEVAPPSDFEQALARLRR